MLGIWDSGCKYGPRGLQIQNVLLFVGRESWVACIEMSFTWAENESPEGFMAGCEMSEAYLS